MSIVSRGKFLKTVLISASMLAYTNALADYGTCHYGNEVYQSITCMGVATLNGTTVKETTHVMGPLLAKNAHLNKLSVQGVATLDDTRISGEVDISGTLIANRSTFLNNILINSNEIHFTDSNVAGFISMRSKWKTPYIYLKSGAQVNNINFTEHAGVVVVDKASKMKGHVVNGRIEQRY